MRRALPASALLPVAASAPRPVAASALLLAAASALPLVAASALPLGAASRATAPPPRSCAASLRLPADRFEAHLDASGAAAVALLPASIRAAASRGLVLRLLRLGPDARPFGTGPAMSAAIAIEGARRDAVAAGAADASRRGFRLVSVEPALSAAAEGAAALTLLDEVRRQGCVTISTIETTRDAGGATVTLAAHGRSAMPGSRNAGTTP